MTRAAGWWAPLSGIVARHHVIVAGLVLGVLMVLGRLPPPFPFDNQATYLLNGLAEAGFGNLSGDWTANAQTPFVVFSAIIRGLAAIGFLNGTYLLGGVLVCVFAVACTTLFSWCRDGQGRSPAAIELFALLLLAMALHDGFMVLMLRGMAGQYTLGLYLQPSEFGVLLILSVALFVARRPLSPYLLAALAGVFHQSYLLIGAVLVAAFASWDLVFERRVKSALAGAAAALAIAAPMAWFSYAEFVSADPATIEAAQRILSEFRFPHHALPAQWFDRIQALKLVIMALAIALSWFLNRRLAFVMTMTAGLGGLLTGLALLIDSHAVYLLFPWRVTTVLMPLAAVVMLASVVRLAIDGRLGALLSRPGVRTAMAACAVLIAAVGCSQRLATLEAVETGAETAWITGQDRERDYQALLRFARANAAQGQTYLHNPLRYFSFRIRAGQPTYVDFKSHPYRSDQVVQWWDRQLWAHRIFIGGRACSPALVAEIGSAGITHVIIDRRRDALDADHMLECLAGNGAAPTMVHDNPTYRVIALSSP